MFVLAHIGIAVGLAYLIGIVVQWYGRRGEMEGAGTAKPEKEKGRPTNRGKEEGGPTERDEKKGVSLKRWRWGALSHYHPRRCFSGGPLDLRFVAVGAILSDLIDKPLGHLLLRDSLDNGRLLAHTLVFLLVISAIAALRRNAVLTALSFGLAVHLGLDGMWTAPKTLLWPLYGFRFPAYDFELAHWWELFTSDPLAIGGEILGAVMIVFLFIRLGLGKKGALGRFLRKGEVGAD